MLKHLIKYALVGPIALIFPVGAVVVLVGGCAATIAAAVVTEVGCSIPAEPPSICTRGHILRTIKEKQDDGLDS